MTIGAAPGRRDRRRPGTTVLVGLVGLAGVAALALTACSATGAVRAPASEARATNAPLRVATSFYALQYVAERVGGDAVEVDSLTRPGVDPHDVELSPRQVRELGQADAVVVLSGFQPSVDEAVAAREPEHLLDVREAARLVPPGAPRDEDASGHTHAEDGDHTHDTDDPGDTDDPATPAHEDGHADDEHDDEVGHDEAPAHDDHAHDDGHDHGTLAGLDPHFWLDPLRMVDVGHAVADLLTDAAPEHAARFAAGARELEADLLELDTAYHDGLAACERDVVVTSHTSFGYLARAYGFTEVGIAGLEPDNEPSPARLREVRRVLAEHDLTTIYASSIASRAVPAALAEAMGLEVAVLDPIEVQTDPDEDYLDVMRANLDALRAGLGCR